MSRLPVVALAIVLTCLLGTTLSAAACGTQSAKQSAQNDSERTQVKPLKGSAEDYQRARFDDPTRITNRWLPLKPGTKRVYEGSAFEEEEKRRSTRRVVSIVTDLTKEIDGVRTLVVWERDYTAGLLGETEIAFFAQDNAGHVWLLGEAPFEYVNGKFDEAPVWIGGLRGARAGIAMQAQPRLGTPRYSQGFSPPPVDFTDRAKVYKTDQQTCTPVDCYKNVLVTEESAPEDPGAFQLKYYAPGVGNVRVGWRGANEEEKEELALVSFAHLSPQALAKVRKEAVELDERTYKRSKIYRQLHPVEPLGDS